MENVNKTLYIPFGGRFSMAILFCESTNRKTVFSSFFRLSGFILTGISAVKFSLNAVQYSITGHFSQSGVPFAIHIFSPSSINASLNLPDCSGNIFWSFRCVSFLTSDNRTFSLIPQSLAITRRTLPSTAVTFSLKQIEAIAPAVYSPIPDNLRISS